MKPHIIIVVFTLLASFSWVVLSYDRYAKLKGWPVSRWYEENTSLIKIASFVSLPGSALASAYVAQWWSAFMVIIVGFCIAQLMTSLFKKNVQYIALVGVPIFLFISILILHNIKQRTTCVSYKSSFKAVKSPGAWK
jgi:magnesium-transporting ATPase (P-type)